MLISGHHALPSERGRQKMQVAVQLICADAPRPVDAMRQLNDSGSSEQCCHDIWSGRWSQHSGDSLSCKYGSIRRMRPRRITTDASRRRDVVECVLSYRCTDGPTDGRTDYNTVSGWDYGLRHEDVVQSRCQPFDRVSRCVDRCRQRST